MKGFKLYFYQNKTPVLFSSFQEKDYSSLTFDENLEKELNDRHTLTFSILKDVGIAGVQLYNFLKVGKKIRLEYDQFNNDNDNYVDFIISSVSPVKTSDNILYNFTCEDYASFKFTRNNIGLNLNTFDDEDWLEYLKDNFDLTNENDEPIGNIISIGNYLLERGTLRNGQEGWEVICDDEDSRTIPFNIELSDSNTYNGLVEIANLTHTNFFINYENKTIDFKYKGSSDFYKNYVLSPELNLQDASFNYDGNDFYSILYVSGTDNEYDVDVGLTPTLTNKFFTWMENNKNREMTIEQYRNGTFYDEFLLSYDQEDEKEKREYEEIKIINKIPYLDNFIFDFDYFQEAGLITKDEHDEIIEKWILNDLRKINIDYQRLHQMSSRYNYNIESTLNKMINTCELLNKAKDGSIKEYNKTLKSLFMTEVKEGKTKLIIEKEDPGVNQDRTIYESEGESVNILSVGYPLTANFSIEIDGETYSRQEELDSSFISFDIYDIEDGTKHKVYITMGLNPDRDFIIEKSTVYDLVKDSGWVLTGQGIFDIMVSSIDELPETSNEGAIAYIKTTGKFYKYVIEKVDTWKENVNTENPVTLLDVLKYTIEIPDGKGKITFDFFDDLSWYRGTNNIIEFYLERIKQELIENIKERNNLIKNISEIESKLIRLDPLDLQPGSSDFTPEIRILQEDLAGAKSLLLSLEEEIGSWDYIPNTEPITEPIAMRWTIEDHGFKTDYLNNEGKVIKLEEEGRLSLFFRSFVDFLNEYSWTDHIEVEYYDSLYKRLQDKLKEKEKFWFDFKEKYGDVLIEGFYHNDLESKPEKLLEYANLYFRTYKTPKDDYSIEYLDASDVLGTEVKNIDVGDYISISKQDIDFVDKLNQDLRVASISRNLRSSTNISLTIDKIQKTQLLLEKMIMQSYK